MNSRLQTERSEHARRESPELSVVIPALNEACSLNETLAAVGRVRGSLEVIVVDGGSEDETIEIARRHHALVIRAERGRGAQMHAGACAASGRALWFLHADTLAPADAAERIRVALGDPATVGGNFGIRFDGDQRAARFLSWLYPQLRRLGLAYGDSGIFARSDAYELIGGFKPYPVFEDLDFICRLGRAGRVTLLPSVVTTSSRRFENRSFAWTFARWATMQLLYWAGVHPRTLARLYVPVRREVRRGEGQSAS